MRLSNSRRPRNARIRAVFITNSANAVSMSVVCREQSQSSILGMCASPLTLTNCRYGSPDCP